MSTDAIKYTSTLLQSAENAPKREVLTPAQALVAPFFQKRPGRRIEGLTNEDYLKIPAVQSSLLKEKTSKDMLCRIEGMMALPLELQRLIELRGGNSSDVMELVEQETRTVPTNFLRLGTAATPAKMTDTQKALLEALQQASEVKADDFNAGTVKSAVSNGWAERFVKEALKPVTEETKKGRAEALVLGTVFHMCILEPHRFHADAFYKEWQIAPGKSLTSEEALKALADDPTRKLITPEIVERARRISEAVWEHDEAKRILTLPGKAESTIEVWDPEFQVMRKIKVDWLPDSQDEGELDLKKTCDEIDNESEDMFEGGDWRPRAICRRFGYHIQRSFFGDTLAMYEQQEAVKNKTSFKRRPHSRILLATDRAPYKVRVFDMEGVDDQRSLICEGRGLYRNRLAKFVLAYMDNKWEAYQHEGCVTLTNGRTTLS